jgi:hypothetical protein
VDLRQQLLDQLMAADHLDGGLRRDGARRSPARGRRPMTKRTKVGSPTPAPKRQLPPALAANIWKPGQSGNPSGHSAEYGEVLRLARMLSVRAIERLAELMESADERVAVVAANAILDRAHGKPRPLVEKHASMEDRIAAMSPAERLARLRELTQKALQTLEHDGHGRGIQIEAEEMPAEMIKADDGAEG